MGFACERLAYPLDVPTLDEARTQIAELAEHVGVFKVGLQLYTAAGPDTVRAVHDAGARCFLDLKLHDIPNTMAGAVRSAVELGVALLTVHAGAGPTALGAVAEAAEGSSTRLLAVTVLTSTDAAQLQALGIAESAQAHVERLSRLAEEAGITGFVSSPEEAASLRTRLGDGAYLVTPGIRPAGSDRGDQRRVATPAQAIRAGADLLVVGRPIRLAPNRAAAAATVVNEIRQAAPST